MKLRWSQAILLILSCLATSTQSAFLDTPTLRWSLDLGEGRSLRQGNAVVTSPGGDKVFCTADDGSLHILDVTSEPRIAAVFEPSSIARTYTEGRSGVVIMETEQQPYLVYAVVDTPRAALIDVSGNVVVGDDNQGRIASRVFAIDLDGSLRWSVAIDGAVVGTPVVGANGTIFVSHTVVDQGSVSVILPDGDGRSAQVAATLTPDPDRVVPLGPPAISRQERASEGGDLVAVAENWDDGYTEEGSIYLLVQSPAFEEMMGLGDESYEFRLISRSSWAVSSVMAPLFVGSSLWLGGTSSNLAGWTANRDVSDVLNGREEDVDPRWSMQLTPNLRNASQPLMTTPVLSSDGSQLFIPGASNTFVALESAAGRESWSTELDSLMVNAPVISEGEGGTTMVYLVESMDGRIRQVDATNGVDNWQFTCQDVTGIASCQDSVEAEFSVARGRNNLFYGTIHGTIVALEVAVFETQAPTANPTGLATAVPSGAPSLSPAPTTSAPTADPAAKQVVPPVDDGFDQSGNALEANNDDDGGTNIGIVIGAAVAGLVVVTLGALFVSRSLMSKTKKRKGKGKSGTIAVTEADFVKDLEGGAAMVGGADMGDQSSDGSSDDQSVDDSVIVSSHGHEESVEVEVTAGGHLYNTPVKRSRKKSGWRRKRKSKAARSPHTPITLESISEVEGSEDSEESSEDNDGEDEISFMMVNDDGQDPKADLNGKFHLVAEVDDCSTTENLSLEKGQVGQSRDGGHLELSVGFNNLRPLADDASDSSDDSASPPPPPPDSLTVEDQSDTEPIQEEKKDEDRLEDQHVISPQPSFGMASEPFFGMTSPQPFFGMAPEPTSPDQSRTSFFGQVAAALTLSPALSTGSKSSSRRALSPAPSIKSQGSGALSPVQSGAMSPAISTTYTAKSPLPQSPDGRSTGHMSPGAMSTDSSLYMDNKSGMHQGQKLSPLSPHVLSKTLDEGNAPDDEGMGTPNLLPSLGHKYTARRSRDGDDDSHDDHDEIMRAPGGHYIPNVPGIRQQFKPSSSASGVKSARTKRNLKGFTPLNYNSDSESSSEGLHRRIQPPEPKKKNPSFKRRNKRDELLQPPEGAEEDTWGSFLNDLAAAETLFFSPTHAQKSAVLRYNNDDDEEEEAYGPDDEDADTVQTGQNH